MANDNPINFYSFLFKEALHLVILSTLLNMFHHDNLFYFDRATRVCTFSSEHTRVFSASDDKTVRQWDIPTEKETHTLKGATVSHANLV